MEGLDLLKQDWKKQEQTLPKYKSADFYPMLLKRSSSMVKWIFFISVLEFVFWIALSVVLTLLDDGNKAYDDELAVFTWASNIIFYIVIVYFMAQFFLNYKRISSGDSVKGLMGNILKTRQTVKYYVIFNLAFFAISFVIAAFLIFNAEGFELPEDGTAISFAVRVAIILVVVLAALVGLYMLLYGVLTKRLKRNYRELKKMEE